MHRNLRRGAIAAGLPVVLLASVAFATSAQDAEPVELTYLVDSTEATQLRAQALADAFTAQNPNVTISLEVAPAGQRRRQPRQDAAGDGRDERHLLVQLRLAVPGAEPDRDAWSTCPASRSSRTSPRRFLPTVSRRRRTSTASRSEPGMGGGILYNKKIYEDLGLSGAHDLGRVRGQQRGHQGGRHRAGRRDATARHTWTSQLFVLADYYNVQAADPGLRRAVHRTTRSSTPTTPAALAGFEHLQEAFEKGWYQEDFGSTIVRGRR